MLLKEDLNELLEFLKNNGYKCICGEDPKCIIEVSSGSSQALVLACSKDFCKKEAKATADKRLLVLMQEQVFNTQFPTLNGICGCGGNCNS